MTTLTVNIDNKKSEKAIKAVLDALGLSYNIEADAANSHRPLNKAEQRIYENMKRSLKEIKLYQEGKIELKPIEDVLAELSQK
jgi:signal recognition particle subunit SEC65